MVLKELNVFKPSLPVGALSAMSSKYISVGAGLAMAPVAFNTVIIWQCFFFFNGTRHTQVTSNSWLGV